MHFDLGQADALLSTTRAVRKRLDFDKPVPREILTECIDISQQAPTGGNSQGWRWLIIEDQAKKDALADLYRTGGEAYLAAERAKAEQAGDKQSMRVFDSAKFLADNLQRAPVYVIPCLVGRPPVGTPTVGLAAMMGSIFPAVWSFQLALRARGLGSCLTSLHLFKEQEAASVLGIPDDVMQVALLPVGYTKGTDFKRATRPDPAEIIHWDSWS